MSDKQLNGEGVVFISMGLSQVSTDLTLMYVASLGYHHSCYWLIFYGETWAVVLTPALSSLVTEAVVISTINHSTRDNKVGITRNPGLPRSKLKCKECIFCMITLCRTAVSLGVMEFRGPLTSLCVAPKVRHGKVALVLLEWCTAQGKQSLMSAQMSMFLAYRFRLDVAAKF